MTSKPGSLPHESAQSFRDAIRHTAITTGFSERLIEKDYFCSLLLRALNLCFPQGLVFKGGTCLSKVHAAFFRLSEDLDFGIAPGVNSTRASRRETAKPFREAIIETAQSLTCFEPGAFDAFNDNRQYTVGVRYLSLLSGEAETIKIDLSLRKDEVLTPSIDTPAQTLILDPLTGEPLLPNFPVRSLSLVETYAEKTRAALTRREPAIRDLFDLDHALRAGHITRGEVVFQGLLRQKLDATLDPIDLSPPRIEAFRIQVETQLKPVLRTADFEKFVLDEIIAILHGIHTAAT